MRISDWSSDVCSSDLGAAAASADSETRTGTRNGAAVMTGSGAALPGREVAGQVDAIRAASSDFTGAGAVGAAVLAALRSTTPMSVTSPVDAGPPAPTDAYTLRKHPRRNPGGKLPAVEQPKDFG